MATLIYKMKRPFDPDRYNGVWGGKTCMRSVRGHKYDSVIGVGGISREPQRHGLSRKVVWIGIGPIKFGDVREPFVLFNKFKFFGSDGPAVSDYAPFLARYIFGGGVRQCKVSCEDSPELSTLLELAKYARPSRELKLRKLPQWKGECRYNCRRISDPDH